MKNKILIVTTAFSPESEIGAVRITKIAKYLVRSGMEVTVISPKLHSFSKVDYEMEEKEFDNIERVQIPHSDFFERFFLRRRNNLLQKGSANSYLKNSDKVNVFSNLKVYIFQFLHFIYTIIRNLDWQKKAFKHININCIENQFDIVFSSYPSIASHWISSQVKKKKIAKKWIADFRDPMNYDTDRNKLFYVINSKIQNNVIKRADIVTYISSDLKFKFPSKYHYKYRLLVNGFDEEDIKLFNDNNIRETSQVLKLCYVGTLYGGRRDLSIIFKAISELESEKLINISNIKISYAGNEYHILDNQASRYNLSSVLVNRGIISRRDSLRLQNNSDIIIVSTWNTENDKGIITGKIYEAFLTKRTILGVVNGTIPDSEFKKIINDVNAGFVIEESSISFRDDYNGLKLFIKWAYDKVIESHFLESSYYNNKLDYYKYSNITKRLISFFN